VAFLAFVHLALFLALSLSPGNSLVSSLCDHSRAYASWSYGWDYLLCSCETWNLSSSSSSSSSNFLYSQLRQLQSCIDSRVRVTRNALKLRGTTLFGKIFAAYIGMKVSNRCSIIALVSLYPSCYSRRNCYFGRKCRVVEI